MMNIERAHKLRKQLTDAERRLWQILRGRRLSSMKFRRQQSIGPFVADFVCFERQLVLELDGGQHSEQELDDEARTRWLEAKGYRVLRFWNNDVLANPEGVARAIVDFLKSPPPEDPSPQPSPEWRGR